MRAPALALACSIPLPIFFIKKINYQKKEIMWLLLHYLTTHNKKRSHTISGTDPARTVQELMERYGIYPENILSVTIDGKEIEPEQVKTWLSI